MTSPSWARERAAAHFRESARVKEQAGQACLEPVLEAAARVAACFRAGGKLLLCGNGGSAADCQHVAAELVSRLTMDFARPGLPALALTTDTSFLTAFANDCGYEGVFARQVQALGKAGDVLVGISTSGNSRNVVLAVEAARAAGMGTIVLTGSGGKLAALADLAVQVPSTCTAHIQESHLAIEHVLCDLVERMLYGPAGTDQGS
jgi:D-sedoheptulose 7-phosphate isomerase